MTLERIDRRLLDLIPSLARFVPPAAVVDKHFYSPFVEGELLELLRSRRIDTLVITGAEPMFAYWRQFLARSILDIGSSWRPTRCAARPI
jgi:hypothetical protein